MARTRNNVPTEKQNEVFNSPDSEIKKILNSIFGVDAAIDTNCKCAASPSVDPVEVFHIVPEKILKSNNATIVFWKDGTKTLVRCAEGTEPNDYNAFTAALAIRLFGSNSQLKKVIQDKTVVQKLKKPKNNTVQKGGAEV